MAIIVQCQTPIKYHIYLAIYQCRKLTRTCSCASRSIDPRGPVTKPRRMRTCQTSLRLRVSRTVIFSRASWPLKYLRKTGQYLLCTAWMSWGIMSGLAFSSLWSVLGLSGKRRTISSSQRDSRGDARCGERIKEDSRRAVDRSRSL